MWFSKDSLSIDDITAKPSSDEDKGNEVVYENILFKKEISYDNKSNQFG